MGNFDKRYPAKWRPIKINNYTYNDTKLNSIIIGNQNEIIKLCDTVHHKKIKKLINGLMVDEKVPFHILRDLSRHCFETILISCIENNDLEMFKTAIQHHCSNNCYSILEIIRLICVHEKPIPFINILIENNIKICSTEIAIIISTNNTEAIDYLVSLNYDIHGGWTEYLSLLYSVEHIDVDTVLDLVDVPMIKTLMDNNINIELNLDQLIGTAIECNNDYSEHNVMEFLVESFSTAINVNQYLNICCENHNEDALIYFLKRGANIHVIDTNSLETTSIDIIKILINHNYSIPIEILKVHLIYCFKRDSDLANTDYLLSIGAQIKWIFDSEKVGETRDIECGKDHGKHIYSLLEFIITTGRFELIKFLAENYLTLLRPEINRLFV